MSWCCQQNQTARLERPQYAVEVALDRPWLGLRLLANGPAAWNRMDGVGAAVRPLQFSATPPVAPEPERLEETFVRGDELIADYQELPGRDIHPRAVWRDLYPRVRQPAVELRLYARTRWLASQPRINLRTRFPGTCEVSVRQGQRWRPLTAYGRSELALTAADCGGGFLVRPPHAEWSYGELIYAADFRGAVVRWDVDGAVLVYPIFLEPLEKGVVRVGRIWSVWLPREDDERALAKLDHLLQTEAPPLGA